MSQVAKLGSWINSSDPEMEQPVLKCMEGTHLLRDLKLLRKMEVEYFCYLPWYMITCMSLRR